MIRNLKALGVALCAVFALGATMASAASAQDVFTTPASPTHLTGTQIGGAGAANLFGIHSVSTTEGVTCASATYTGTINNGATSATVHPSYTGCTAFGVPATIDVPASCNFILTGTTDNFTNTSGVAEGKDATVNLECNHTSPANDEIVITIPSLSCNLKVGVTHPPSATTLNQNLLGVRYTNEGSGATADIKVDVTVDNIAYRSEKFGCALAGIPATGTDGFLTTNVTVKGYSDAAHTKQVGISSS